jgi:hypothetical protein
MPYARWFQDRVWVYVGIMGLLVSSVAVVACSSDEKGSGDTSLVVEVLQDSITLENQTGTSLTKGEMSVIPQGIPRPYVMILPHMTNGAKRTFQLSSFRMSDGSPFRRDIANGRTVRITARDATGKTYEREVPFK